MAYETSCAMASWRTEELVIDGCSSVDRIGYDSTEAVISRRKKEQEKTSLRMSERPQMASPMIRLGHFFKFEDHILDLK